MKGLKALSKGLALGLAAAFLTACGGAQSAGMPQGATAVSASSVLRSVAQIQSNDPWLYVGGIAGSNNALNVYDVVNVAILWCYLSPMGFPNQPA